MSRNLFFTGPRQVGKSTLIKRLLAGRTLRLGGFITRPVKAPNGLREFKLVDLNPHRVGAEGLICRAWSDQHYEAIPETFESYGATSLEYCLSGQVDLIIMDELGAYEEQAPKFKALAHECLSSDIPVLGVLKAKDRPFIRSIRQRQDILFFYIDEMNRDHIYNELCETFEGILGAITGKKSLSSV